MKLSYVDIKGLYFNENSLKGICKFYQKGRSTISEILVDYNALGEIPNISMIKSNVSKIKFPEGSDPKLVFFDIVNKEKIPKQNHNYLSLNDKFHFVFGNLSFLSGSQTLFFESELMSFEKFNEDYFSVKLKVSSLICLGKKM